MVIKNMILMLIVLSSLLLISCGAEISEEYLINESDEDLVISNSNFHEGIIKVYFNESVTLSEALSILEIEGITINNTDWFYGGNFLINSDELGDIILQEITNHENTVGSASNLVMFNSDITFNEAKTFLESIEGVKVEETLWDLFIIINVPVGEEGVWIEYFDTNELVLFADYEYFQYAE
ncbi:hypothetical protein HN385_05305 [archaeon]|nr:hypothetical protein [archaeon]MBT3451507.1 hypothetical protein [archaeon]MBT6869500.1 hypothetical protein [archaeon]MBT7193188.1 hypothetical protein [archaeon]MBT7380494.1 hypothetical protein [archaeon]